MKGKQAFRCNLCGHSRAETLFEASDRRFQIPGSFPVVRCTRCGLVCVHPQPSKATLTRHYPPEYYTHAEQKPTVKDRLNKAVLHLTHSFVSGTESGGDSVRRRMAAALMHLRPLKETAQRESLGFLKRGDTVLEIGYGRGAFLRFLRSKGIQAVGIENDPLSHDHMKRQGFDVHLGELHSHRFDGGMFDGVRMRHVLEHVRDPKGLLREVHRILKPNGFIHIEVPNFGGLFARAFGPAWVQLEIPRHLFQFSVNTLSRLLEENHLSVANAWTVTFPWQLQGSLQYVLNEIRQAEDPSDNRTRDLWSDGRISSSLHQLTRWISKQELGDNIIVLARKSSDASVASSVRRKSYG